MDDTNPTAWFEGIEHLLGVGASVIAILAIAYLAADWLTRLQTRLRGTRGSLRRVARWLPILQIAVWVAALVVAMGILLEAPAIVIVIVVAPAAAALVVGSRDFVRNGIAGAILTLERSILTGDLIDVTTSDGEVEGRVIAIGVRTTVLQRSDSTEVLIPNQTLLNSTVRTNRAHEQDSAVEIELAVDEEFTTAEFPRIRAIAENAAAVSRYASPHRRPEAFLEPGGDGHYRLTVQAYAFAPEYIRQLRTDIVSLFNETTELDGESS